MGPHSARAKRAPIWLGQDDNPGSNPVKVTRSSFKIDDEREGGKLS